MMDDDALQTKVVMNTDGGASSLEQFCLLAKTAKGRACVELIKQVSQWC